MEIALQMQLPRSIKAGWYTASKVGDTSEDRLADLGPCISALLRSASRRRRQIACLEFNDSEMRRSWKDCAVWLPRIGSMNLDLKGRHRQGAAGILPAMLLFGTSAGKMLAALLFVESPLALASAHWNHGTCLFLTVLPRRGRTGFGPIR